MNALEQIYQNLQQGKRYGTYFAMRFAAFHDCLWVDWHRTYIHWNNYGGGANRNTVEELAWVLKQIFRTTPEQFLKVYQVYDEETMKQWKAAAEAQGTNEYRVMQAA